MQPGHLSDDPARPVRERERTCAATSSGAICAVRRDAMVGALPTLHPAPTTTPRSDASEDDDRQSDLSPAQCSGENLMGSRSGR